MTSMESLLQHMESFKKILKAFAKKPKLEEVLNQEQTREEMAREEVVRAPADS